METKKTVTVKLPINIPTATMLFIDVVALAALITADACIIRSAIKEIGDKLDRVIKTLEGR